MVHEVDNPVKVESDEKDGNDTTGNKTSLRHL